MEESREVSETFTLAVHLRILRELAKFIAVLTITAGMLGLLWSSSRTPVYAADTEVLLDFDSSSALLGTTGEGWVDRPRRLQNELRRIDSSSIRNSIDRRFGVDPVMSATGGPGSDTLLIQAQASSPALAVELVNAYTDAYVTDLRAREAAEFRAAAASIDTLLNRGAESPFDDAAGERRTELSDRRDVLLAAAAVAEQTSGSIISPAELPDKPISPNVARDTTALTVLGLMSGIGLGYVRNHLDRRIGNEADVRRLGLDATVSSVLMGGRTGTGAHESAEEFRSLRATWTMTRPDDRSLFVASVDDGFSGVDVAIGLAASMSMLDDVLLVDADLRAGRLTQRLGESVAPGSGLAGVLTGSAVLPSAVRSVEGFPNLEVILSDAPVGGAAELVQPGGEQHCSMEEVIDWATRSGRRVIVVGPPLSDNADSLLLARQCDAAVLAVRRNATVPARLLSTIERLERVGVSPHGVVLVGGAVARTMVSTSPPVRASKIATTKVGSSVSAERRPRPKAASSEQRPSSGQPHKRLTSRSAVPPVPASATAPKAPTAPQPPIPGRSPWVEIVRST